MAGSNHSVTWTAAITEVEPVSMLLFLMSVFREAPKKKKKSYKRVSFPQTCAQPLWLCEAQGRVVNLNVFSGTWEPLGRQMKQTRMEQFTNKNCRRKDRRGKARSRLWTLLSRRDRPTQQSPFQTQNELLPWRCCCLVEPVCAYLCYSVCARTGHSSSFFHKTRWDRPIAGP